MSWIRKMLLYLSKSKNNPSVIEYDKVVQELREIRSNLYPSNDITKEEYFNAYKALNLVSFWSENSKLVKELPFLKTLKVDTTFFSLTKTRYELSYDEYKKYYLDGDYLYLNHLLLKTINLLNVSEMRPAYEYLVIKFSLSAYAINNAIKESYKLNGGVTEEIFRRTGELLKMFTDEVFKIEERHLMEQQEEDEAVNKGIIERLDDEITYMKEYVIRD